MALELRLSWIETSILSSLLNDLNLILCSVHKWVRFGIDSFDMVYLLASSVMASGTWSNLLRRRSKSGLNCKVLSLATAIKASLAASCDIGFSSGSDSPSQHIWSDPGTSLPRMVINNVIVGQLARCPKTVVIFCLSSDSQVVSKLSRQIMAGE